MTLAAPAVADAVLMPSPLGAPTNASERPRRSSAQGTGTPADGAAMGWSARLVPKAPPERDRILPLILAVSLILHTAMLLSFRREHGAPAQREIAVELVQLAPKPASKSPPPSPPAAQAPRRSAQRRVTQKPPSKPTQSIADRLKDLLGPMPAFALPAAADAGAEPASYSQLVLSQVAKAKKQGRYRGIPGKAGVAFRLGDKGEIVKVELVQPSGDPSLDEEAVAMVKRGAPYPPPPPGGRRDYAITLRFSAIP